MNARLDYCNVLHYYGVSARNVQQLQRIRNLLVSYATYRIIDLPLIHSRVQTLHWLRSRQSYIELSIHKDLLASLLHQFDHPAVLTGIYCNNVELYYTVTASRALAVAAPGIWNSFPVCITASVNYCMLKPILKLTYLPPRGPNSGSVSFLRNTVLYRRSFVFVLYLYCRIVRKYNTCVFAVTMS